ncbi:methyltransferase, putative [Actinidia rufa]|uniref:Methyltransferase, putative n=1 Tax=Actinidia rufa TaxID=165716 RepID=A0A7J0EI53_9ERIC|nr:methyltransferase, putative [Actinidia rufa]
MGADVPCCVTTFWLFLVVVVGLVMFAGLMAGLTLGLMSLGLVDLEVLMKSGRPQDRIHASKIFPVVKNQHLLLCTLLIGNSLAMESLPIFLDKLVPPWAAILISVTLILMFGEIMPQAICTRYGLTVGATAAPFVHLLLWLFFPVAYPISKAGKGGDLTRDETTIIAGALELTEKTAKDAMTPIKKAFSLDLDATLNLETLNAIMTMGHSRVPIYAGNPTNIIGLILVKNLLTVDPEDAVPVRKMLIRKIPRVSENMPLYDILNEFQKGHSHIAIVYKDLNGTKMASKEDKEGKKKMNLFNTILTNKPRLLLRLSLHQLQVIMVETSRRLICFTDFQKNHEVDLVTGIENHIKLQSHDADVTMSKSDGDQQKKKSPPPTPAFKKRHRGCSFCILDVENVPLPVSPPGEEVVGVITMEDVIEELLQEEILDETDEYVNIHNRIKVNMHASSEKIPVLNSPPHSPVPSHPAAPAPAPTHAVSSSDSQ